MVEETGTITTIEPDIIKGTSPIGTVTRDIGGGLTAEVLRGRVSSETLAEQESRLRGQREARRKAQTAREELTSLRQSRTQQLKQRTAGLLTSAKEKFDRAIRRAKGSQGRLEAQQSFRAETTQIKQQSQQQTSQIRKASSTQLERKLPFETAIREIPKATGRFARKVTETVGLRGETVIAGARVPRKETISGIPSPAELRTPEFRKPIPELTQEATQLATTVGQFLIPVVGETLFVGSLLERPILQPKQFAKEVAEKPFQTAALFSLGFLSVKGGLKNALSKAEAKAFNAELKIAKTRFIATADKDTINILSGLKVRGKSFVSRSQLKRIQGNIDKSLSRGVDVRLKKLPKGRTEAIISQIFTQSKKLGQARAVVEKRFPAFVKGKGALKAKTTKIRAFKNIEGTPFLVQSAQVDRLRLVFNNKRGFNIPMNRAVDVGEIAKAEFLSPSIVKSKTVGIIQPTEVENLFKVLAGSPKLRVFKTGGVSFVFDPRIEGWLKIARPSGGFGATSKTVTLKQLQQELPLFLPPLQKELRAQAIAESKRLGVKAKVVGKAIARTRTLAGASTLAQIKRTRAENIAKSPLTQKAATRTAPFSTAPLVKAEPLAFAKLKRVQTSISGSTPKSLSAQAVNQRAIAKVKSDTKQQLKVVTTPLARTNVLQRQRTRLKVLTKQAQQLRQVQSQRTRLLSAFPFPKPKPKIGLPLKVGAVKGKKIVKKKAIPLSKIGYDVFFKPTKKKKFVKINKVPVSKARARDAGAFLADRSLSAQFRIKRTDKIKKKLKIKVPQGFFSRTQKKFRTFKIRKGKRIPLKNIFIEKRGRRLDTRSEVKRITGLKLLANLKRKVGLLKPKKKRGVKK